jgi:tripartite-type tricarboxylate transporter receptor subunit TctC
MTMNGFWRALAIAAIAVCGSLLQVLPAQILPANAQAAWPPKTMRIIVPFPPGGTTDVIARRVQPLLERNLKTTVVIENRGGASGSIGTQAAVAAAPDGATFVLVFDTHGANPALLPNLPYDTVKDLAPVMLIGTSPMVITAHSKAAYRNFADVVTAARAGTVSYGTIGSGSLAHLAMSQIGNALNVTMTHVPYKGGGPLTTDAVAGHVPVAIASIALLSAHIKSEVLRPLAVTSAKRVEWLQGTPAVSELGVSGFDAEAWWGLLAPAKTPPEIVTRMHAAMRDALSDAGVKQSLSEQGLDYRLSSPDEFGRFVESEIKRWTKVVNDNKISATQ